MKNRKVLFVGIVIIISLLHGCGKKDETDAGKNTGADTPPDWQTVIAQPSLRMRSRPAVDSETITLIPFKGQVQVLTNSSEKCIVAGYEGSWDFVKYGDKTGWVFDVFLLSGKIPEDRSGFWGTYKYHNYIHRGGNPSWITLDPSGRYRQIMSSGQPGDKISYKIIEGGFRQEDDKIIFLDPDNGFIEEVDMYGTVQSRKTITPDYLIEKELFMKRCIVTGKPFLVKAEFKDKVTFTMHLPVETYSYDKWQDGEKR